MARIREEIHLVQNVGAGQRCLVSPSVGRTWLDFHIELANITLEQATDIRVLLVSPTKTITLWEFKDGDELFQFNQRYKRKVDEGKLSFYFRRPEMENEGQSMATALGTGGLQALRVEFNIAPGVANPGVTAWGRKTANRAISAGILQYIVNHNIGGQAEGDNYFDALEKRDRIAAIHVLNENVTALNLKLDDAIVYDLTRVRGVFDEQMGDRLPYGSGYGMVIDFTTAGVLDESLVMQGSNYQAQQMRLTATLGAEYSGTSRVLVEYLSTWVSLAGANTQRAA